MLILIPCGSEGSYDDFLVGIQLQLCNSVEHGL